MSSLVRKEANDAIDKLELALLQRYSKIECPLNHTFADQIYIREIFMAAGSKITSKIHRFRHPFFVLKGSANIWLDGIGWQYISAPYFGVTERGTRRVLDIIEDMNFITVHSNPNNTEDLDEIEESIIEEHINPLLNSNNETRLHE